MTMDGTGLQLAFDLFGDGEVQEKGAGNGSSDLITGDGDHAEAGDLVLPGDRDVRCSRTNIH